MCMPQLWNHKIEYFGRHRILTFGSLWRVFSSSLRTQTYQFRLSLLPPLFRQRSDSQIHVCVSLRASFRGQVRFLMCDLYSWFSREVTKIQTKGLSILQSFYIHEVLEKLKTDIFTSFHFERVLCTLFSDLLSDAAFTQRLDRAVVQV